ncbi:UDP-N-acetylmuramate--L-alanine ligase [Patescibacteria group bacterium]|nr:UDP-N-acetylmuramate--L-alanine ligase [Patescibacteria group bacterium]
MKFLKNVKKIHFIGIGGVGVSAIARMARLKKIKVSGSDQSISLLAEKIQNIGGKICVGHKKENINNVDMVVYSPAIQENNPELVYARKLNIPCFSYPEILGLISKDAFTIAVSGTHGKTTTVSMLAEVLIYSNLDPTVVVGGLLKKQQDNFVLGDSNIFLVEACEYKKSFLNLYPNILVITNIDSDHLDYYSSFKEIQKTFNKLIDLVPKHGHIVCNSKDVKVKRKIIDYTKEKIDFNLLVPGEHNRSNAKIVLAVGGLLNIKREKIVKILKKYEGTWRRFDYMGITKNNSLVYNDYAHHPNEIKAVIQGVREKYPDKKLIVVFQPHLYSRTKIFLNDFKKALNMADKIIITDIYAAREKNDESIHAKDLLIKKSKYIKETKNIIKELKQKKDSIILIIGAGDVYKIGEKLVDKDKT